MSTAALSVKQKESLRRLDEFSVSEWSRWIRTLLEGSLCDPDIAIGRTTPDRMLIWLFETGLTTTGRFVEALGKIYEGSTPKRPQQLYYLLQAISVIRPDVCKDLLLRHLKERRFDGVCHEGFDLKSMALATRSRYAFSEDLRIFTEHSAVTTEDFSYRLTCFKTLADADPTDAFRYIHLILPFIDGPKEQKVFGGLLRGLGWAESHRPLYEWYASRDRKRLADSQPEQVENLNEVLRKWVVPWQPEILGKDPYAVLLSASVFAGHRPFVAKEVLFLAQCVTSKLVSTVGSVIYALRTVWDQTLVEASNWSTMEPLGLHEKNDHLPWMLCNDHQRLYTNWDDLLLERDAARTFFDQDVCVSYATSEENELVLEALSRGSRLMPHEAAITEDGFSIEDEFHQRIRLFHKELAPLAHVPGGG